MQTGIVIMDEEQRRRNERMAIHAVGFLSMAFSLTLSCGALSLAHARPKLQDTSAKQAQFLEIGDAKIYYQECGSGPTIVLLHDGLLGSSTWDDVWSPLCLNFHVLRYDRRGFGRSDSPKSSFSPTADLLALLQHTNSKQAVVVGNSSGAALAIDFALEHPEVVQGLFLIGPVVHASIESSAYFVERGQKNNAPLENNDVLAAAENWSRDRFLFAAGAEAARKKFLDAIMKYPQSLRYAGNLEIRPPAAGSRLPEIQAPTIIMTGEYDIADVHAFAGVIQFGVRDSVRVVVKYAGHLIQLEQPTEVVDRISRFVVRAARKAVNIDSKTLEAYAGRYRLGATTLTVVSKDKHLIIQLPDEPQFLFYAEADALFFTRTRDVEVEFARDSAGKVTELLIHQGGGTIRCLRL